MKRELPIFSACDVDEQALADFYSQEFSNRQNVLPHIWQWLNRVDFFHRQTPLVMLDRGRVVAHAGMQPFSAAFDGKCLSAAWFIDFKIRKEFQRQGLGLALTEKWMTFPDCCVTFCNEKSIGVFKKMGWTEDFRTYQHINFMNAFDHPGFQRRLPSNVRKMLNLTIKPLIWALYKSCAYGKNHFTLEPLTEKNFWQFYQRCSFSQKNADCFSPVRDRDYALWRILNSPNRRNYHLYSSKNGFSAVLLMSENHGKYIDVLWVTEATNKKEITKMIATLCLCGLSSGAAYLRFYASGKAVSDFVRRRTFSKIRHLRFAFFAKDKEIYEKMKAATYNFELIDGDFEHIR